MQWPKLILINGSSSAGKSTIASLLQEKITDVPYLVFGFDSLVFMSPQRYWADAATPQQSPNNKFLTEGVHMVHHEKNDEPQNIEAVFGSVFKNIIKSMPDVVNTLINNGNYVIFDHVFHDQSMVEQYEKCLGNIKQIKIGINCPLDVLEQREKERGDRVIGRARGLFNCVHQYCSYDLELDSNKNNPNELVNKIINFIKNKNI